MRAYSPRRFGRRWNAEAPRIVLDVFDSGGPGDRYTIFFTFPLAFSLNPVTGDAKNEPGLFSKTYIQYFGTDATPGTNPQGVSMWGEMPAYQVVDYRAHNKSRRIKWLDLPAQVRDYIERELLQLADGF